MLDQGVDSFILQKQGTVVDTPGNWNEDEERHNQFESWTLQLGVDKDLGDNWRMQARLQRGATDRYTTVLNEVRVDREFLAIDAVEVYTDRRDANADGIIDLVPEAQRGTGNIICNVQRYNPTPAQLQAAVAGQRFPQPISDTSLGGPDRSRADPGPGRPGRDPELRADERLRSGQRQPSGA